MTETREDQAASELHALVPDHDLGCCAYAVATYAENMAMVGAQLTVSQMVNGGRDELESCRCE